MNLTLLGAYFLAVLLLLLTPGPVIALVTGTAARYGSRKAFATVAGTNVASLVLIAFAALMLAGILSLSPLVLYLVGIAGSLFIGWSAFTSLQGARGSEEVEVNDKRGVSNRSGFIRGFITGISNPKDILFFVSFFPQFITVTRDFTVSIMTLSFVWMVFDFTVLSLYILMVKRWVPERHGRRIEIVSAVFLLAISLCSILYNVSEIVLRYI
ncbi:LysE family translocator [Winslowiella iniecta]|uniref:Lysine transporter LysE n=1 Tax=Winslowiella iniecta TaxID=1560201 RepID=A0A0L7SXC8_9GAMM|nr:LysE family translocator [Winslowiella iniecta]KOC87773.1 lysine transporter LysE [Winslowiella iniecta]KOC90053.1 lysine transporter LysE [Winslowiella iniecta]